MSKRVRLRFDRSQDIHTREYRIYRSLTPGVTTESAYIARLRHPLSPNPLYYEERNTKRITDYKFELSHTNILLDQPIHFFIDGSEVTGFVIDPDDGYISFDFPVPSTSVVTGNYYWDGLEFIDDTVKQELILQYFGPPAVDRTAPSVPSNVSMVVNPDQVSATIQYLAATVEGTTFYYRIEARNSSGDYSNLSNEVSALLKSGVKEYQIESSINGGNTWQFEGRSLGLSFTAQNVDNEPPEPLQNSTALVEPLKNTGTADIHFNWSVPLLNDKTSYTPKFQVRAISTEDVISEPSYAVGPEFVKSPLNRIVIRRKIADGSYPSFDGTDAVTVTEIYDLTQSGYVDNVGESQIYAYSLFVVDGSGNVSQAVVFELTVDNTSAPEVVSGVTLSVHNTIV